MARSIPCPLRIKPAFWLAGESEPEPVLDLGCVATGEETQAWTVQRLRLSPQEKHLAATLKTCSAETTRSVPEKRIPTHLSVSFQRMHEGHVTSIRRCAVVKLGQRRGLTLDNVVSFGTF